MSATAKYASALQHWTQAGSMFSSLQHNILPNEGGKFFCFCFFTPTLLYLCLLSNSFLHCLCFFFQCVAMKRQYPLVKIVLYRSTRGQKLSGYLCFFLEVCRLKLAASMGLLSKIFFSTARNASAVLLTWRRETVGAEQGSMLFPWEPVRSSSQWLTLKLPVSIYGVENWYYYLAENLLDFFTHILHTSGFKPVK